MRTSLIFLMLLFVAAGCGGTEESSTNPTSLASPVSTTVSSAATLTPTPAPPVPTSAPEPEPTPLPTQTPLSPPGVVVDLEIANVTENSITLQWKSPDNSNVVPIEHYEVTRDIAFWTDEHHAVAETTFIDTELESSTEHRYRVRSIGPGGIEGAEISIVGSTLDSATPAPNRTPIPEPTPTDTPQPTATRTSLPTATATLTPVPTSTPTSEPTVSAETQVDESGFSDVLVWRFCTSFFQGNVEPEQIGLVVGLEEGVLIRENAKHVHRLVMAMYEAQPRVDAGLLKQTYEACEKWRDDDWAESQSK